MIALVHTPSPYLQACERTFVPQTAIDDDKAARQHAAYCQVLRDCGCDVRTLDVNRVLPDCAFIEDTAIVLDEVAVLASMGAASRREEPEGIARALAEFRELERISPEAMLEGGDVLRIGRTLLVGQSRRTSAAGIEALQAIARRYDYRVVAIPVRQCLHLKTACTALPDGRLLVNPNWVAQRALSRFPLVRIDESEPWAANAALVGSRVLMAAGVNRTAELVGQLGFHVATIELSEFAKAEGGVTCLSLLIQ